MTDSQDSTWLIVVVVLVLLGLFVLSPIFMMGFWGFPGGMMGGGMMGPWMMGGGQWGYNPGGAIIGALLPLAFLAIIVVGAYYLLAGRVRPSEPRRATPVEILKERYAKGEITHEDFLRMKEQLSA